jgi:hypothetical protein
MPGPSARRADNVINSATTFITVVVGVGRNCNNGVGYRQARKSQRKDNNCAYYRWTRQYVTSQPTYSLSSRTNSAFKISEPWRNLSIGCFNAFADHSGRMTMRISTTSISAKIASHVIVLTVVPAARGKAEVILVPLST